MLSTTALFCIVLGAAFLGVSPLIRILFFLGLACHMARRVYSSPQALSPLIWFVYAWELALSLYFTGAFVYARSHNGPGGLVFLSVCSAATIGAFLIGTRGCPTPKRRSMIATDSYVRRMSRFVTGASLFGAVGGLLFCIEMLGIGATLRNQSALRDLYVNRNVTVLSQLAAVFCPGSLVAICGLFYFGARANIGSRVIWLLGGLAGLSLSLWSGGRQTAFQLVLTTMICMLTKPHFRSGSIRSSPKVKIAIALGVSAFLLYSVYVAIGRANADASRPRYVELASDFGASPSPEINEIFEILPRPVKDGITEAYMYLAAPTVKFLGLYEIELPKPTYGLYAVPFVTRRLQLFINIPSPVDRLELCGRIAANSGLFANGWETTVGSIALEFGRVHTVPICAMIGFWFAYVWRRFVKAPSFGATLSLVAASLVAIYFPLLPAIADTTVFVLCLIGYGLTRVEGQWHRCAAGARIQH